MSHEKIFRNEFVIYSGMLDYFDFTKNVRVELDSITLPSREGDVSNFHVNAKHFRCESYYFNYVLGDQLESLIKFINPNSKANAAEPNFSIVWVWVSDKKFFWPVLKATCDIPKGIPLVFQYENCGRTKYLENINNFSIIQKNAQLMPRNEFSFKVMKCSLLLADVPNFVSGAQASWSALVERYFNNQIIYSCYNQLNQTLYYIKRDEFTPILRKKGQFFVGNIVLKHSISLKNLKAMIKILDTHIGDEFSNAVNKNEPLWNLAEKDKSLIAQASFPISENIWPKFNEKMQKLGIWSFVSYTKFLAENIETGKNEIVYLIHFIESDLLCVLEKLGCLKDIIALDYITPSKEDSKERVELDSKPPILHALTSDQQKSEMQTRKFNRSAGLGEYANRL